MVRVLGVRRTEEQVVQQIRRFNELRDLPLTIEEEPNLTPGSVYIWTYNNK